MESYQLTQQLFQSLTQKWQDEYSYQENIRYLVTNIIAQRIFGIPEVETVILLGEIAKPSG